MIFAGINYIEQQVTQYQLYLNESFTRYVATSYHNLWYRLKPICKERRVVLRSLENTTRVILAKTVSYSPKQITVH